MFLILRIRSQIYKFILLSILIGIVSHFTNTQVLAQTQGDFSLSISPSSATIQPGSSANFSIAVSKTGNFNSTINFSPFSSNGISVSFSPSSVTPPGTVTMSVSVSTSTAPGTYTLTLSASGGGLTRSASVSIVVPQQSFTLSASPSKIQVTPGTNAVFTVSANASNNDGRFNVSLKASGQLSVNFGISTITTPGSTNMTVLVPSATSPGTYTITIMGSATGAVTQTTSVSVEVRPLPDFTLSIIPEAISLSAGEQTELALSVIGLNGFNDSVSLKVDSKLKASLSTSTIIGSGTATLLISTDRTTAPDTYPVTIIGTSSTKGGIIERRVSTIVSVTAAPDFSLTINPLSLETSPGKPISFSVGVNAMNRFNDVVVLSFNTSNSNITAMSGTTGITPGTTATVNVNVGATTPLGTYDINIVGMASGLQRSSTVKLIVKNGDFDLVLNPTTQSIIAGQKANFAVNINAKDNFTGQVSLTASSPTNTIQTSFSVTTINTSGTSMVTLSTSPTTEPKDYLFTITASVGGVTKNATFTLTVKPIVGDFTLSARPDTQSVAAGKATSFSLDIVGQNGFTNQVALSANVTESSLTVGFAPSNAKPGDNISVTVTTSANTPVGNYQVQVIGTSGSLVKTATINLNVTAAPQEVFSLALAPSKQDIVIGDATMFTLGVIGRNGFNQTVSLSATSPDPNVQVSFAKSSLTPGTNTIVTVNTSSNTPAGTYSIMIIGKSGNVVVTQIVTLVTRVATLQVIINFDPPAMGQIAPPNNVKVIATELKPPTIEQVLTRKIHSLAADSDIAGFKIYRLPAPEKGQPDLTEQDLVKDENLIATLGANDTGFVDNVNAGKSSTGNFVYSVSTFFGNGQNSGGSAPMGTNLPVIKNPVFTKGTIFTDSPSSFIQMGAVIIVNDMDEYPLMFNANGTQFTVAKKTPGSLNGKTLKKLIAKGTTVKLVIKNPDGKLSIARSLTRSK